MAEVLVLTEDRATGDPHLDATSLQRGAVIRVEADGHAWSAEERNRPGFAVVPVPGITVITLAPLAEPDPTTIPDPENPGSIIPNPRWRLRRYVLDLDVLARFLADPPAWLALIEEGGQPAAFEAGLIVATPERP